ncbi:MAG: hydantoinase/oxoprolinase family protein [Methylophilaceae bacterium]
MSVLNVQLLFNDDTIIGWDIGGAHLKAVQIDRHGKVISAQQVYCPLWLGLHELAQAFDYILNTVKAKHHMITMTGELADIFENRASGVQQIAKLSSQKLGENCLFYAGLKGFISADLVNENTIAIASMNWLASVQYVASVEPQAIFVDIGSTTTDIALIADGVPMIKGFNDATRLQMDELVYTGVVRTPLMAVAQKITFNQQLVNVAAEYFATTADVYTLTAELLLEENMASTADGADKTVQASARRIARMVGLDSADAPFKAWRDLAQAFRQAQLNQIKQAVIHQLSFLKNNHALKMVGCGAGEFLVAELAQQLECAYQAAPSLIMAENAQLQKLASVCFPAFALAQLGLISFNNPQQAVSC